MFVSTLVLALSLYFQVSDKPEVEYDKFKDRTHIAIDFKELPGEKGFSLISLHTGHEGKSRKEFDGSESMGLSFYRSGKGWRYLTHHEIQMMCGDDHIPVLNPSYKSDTDKGSCKETLTVHFTLKTLRKYLEKDQDWDIKLGFEDPFTFDAGDRKRMLAFVKFLEEGGG
jgi:hypothetical protein